MVRANVLKINGGSISSMVRLRSMTPSQKWYLTVTGWADVAFADVQDSYASGQPLYARSSLDSGGNTGWVFTAPSLAFMRR